MKVKKSNTLIPSDSSSYFAIALSILLLSFASILNNALTFGFIPNNNSNASTRDNTQPPEGSTAVNHPPVAENMNLTVKYTVPLSFALKATDEDNDKLNFTLATKPVNGEITSFDPSSGAITWNPIPPLLPGHGDSFVFRATDDKMATSNLAVVSIWVVD